MAEETELDQRVVQAMIGRFDAPSFMRRAKLVETWQELIERGSTERRQQLHMVRLRLGQFRIELYNTYPPNNPAAMKAKILELQWDRGDYHMAVWLHQANGAWVVLDTLRWPDGTAF